jgi:hypothetical protein
MAVPPDISRTHMELELEELQALRPLTNGK